MKNYTKESVLLIFLNLLCIFTRNGFGYPKKEISSDNRVPIYIPGRCGQNEMSYPGDRIDDWICDCAPGYINYAPNNKCYAVYRQGPCQSGDHLVLSPDNIASECKKNPCKDQFLKLFGICHQIGKSGGPCRPISEGGGTLGVDISTLKIDCLKPNTDGGNQLTFFLVPSKNCPPGSKRSATGKCRQKV